jgi:DNA-binding NtrC family response regulator
MVSNRRSILVVDDEPSIGKLLCEFLGESYDCHAVDSVSEAQHFLRFRTFDLVIVDILMPGRSGLELCDLIRLLYPLTHVIVLSGVADPEVATQAKRRGAAGYIAKPCDLSLISEGIAIALQSRHDSAVAFSPRLADCGD